MATSKKKDTEEITTETTEEKKPTKKKTTKKAAPKKTTAKTKKEPKEDLEEPKQAPKEEPKEEEPPHEPNEDDKPYDYEEDQKTKKFFEEIGDTVGKFAKTTVDSIKHTIDKSMSSRNTVISVRVNDETNKKLNMLVEAGLFKSRSESASFLIEEGIKLQDPLFQKITAKLEKIEKLKKELKDIISED